MPFAVAFVAVSVALYVSGLVALFLGRRRRLRGEPRLDRFPRVSILKPLAGRDDELSANLASFAAIDYPDYEVLLGIAGPDDAALAAARDFVVRHPWVEARIVKTDPDAARNPKVAQLVGLEAAATGEVLVVSDSNVRVGPRYLSVLVAELARPGTTLVSSLVAGSGERTLGAAIENLNLCATFAPLIAAAEIYAGRALTVGKSMALRRADLRRLGGFGCVSDVLGEDHVLGRLFEAAGEGVRISFEPVENRNVDCSLRRAWERHGRWAKMRRFVAPGAFLVEPIASPILVSCAVALVAPSLATLLLALGAFALQVLGSALAVRVLRGTGVRWYWLALEPLRAALLLACWASAWLSRTISWRGHPYRLHAGSVITPAER